MGKDTSYPSSLSMPTWETLEGWIRDEIEVRIQSIAEEEVTQFLGRGWYERKGTVDAAPGYRNGYLSAVPGTAQAGGKLRRLSTSCGTIKIKRPRVRGLQERFESRILPLFARRTKEVGALLPELYLHGLAQGDFELALRGLLGDGAPLSSSSIACLPGRQQRCWNHKILNVVNQIHKRQQAKARALLVQIPYANTLRDAEKLRRQFIARYQDPFPKAVKALDRDWDLPAPSPARQAGRMLTFFDLPKRHWRHLRTTNVVESPFASVCDTKRSPPACSRQAGGKCSDLAHADGR